MLRSKFSILVLGLLANACGKGIGSNDDLQPKVTQTGFSSVSATTAETGKPVTYSLVVDAGLIPSVVGGTCPLGAFKSYTAYQAKTDTAAEVLATAEYETGAIDEPCTVELTAASPLAFKNPFTASTTMNALGKFPMVSSAPFTADSRKAELAVAAGTIALVNRPAPLKSAFAAFDTKVATPEYKAEEAISGDCPAATQLGDLYVVGPVTADCKVVFNIANPCGETGLPDPTTITYTKSDANATDRIDRIMASTSLAPGNWKGLNPATGLGTSNCAHSGCHGKAIGSDGLPSASGEYWKYDSKYWRIWYTGASGIKGTPQTVYVPDLSKGYDGDITKYARTTDNASFWQDKLIFQRMNWCATPDNNIYSAEPGSEFVTAEADPAFYAYDPLNSRFYRKLTTSHYRPDLVDGTAGRCGNGTIPDPKTAKLTESTRMPRSICTNTITTGCLSENHQAMMCHWIWNGAK